MSRSQSETADETSGEDVEDRDIASNISLPSDALDYLKSEGIKILSFLMKGSASTVYKAKIGKSSVAVKALKIKESNDIKAKESYIGLQNEKQISLFVSHQYIIKTHRILELEKKFYFIVNEFADGGDLITLIEEDNELGEEFVRRFFLQVVDAIDYLHQNGIAHRDIKPDNILLHRGDAKVTDFGLAHFSVDSNNKVLFVDTFSGTHEYSSPENIRCLLKEYSFDPFISDVFSLGILLFIMVTLNFPFGFGNKLRSDEGIRKLYEKEMNEKWKLTQKYKSNEELFSILKQLMNPDVNSRVRVSQIPSHPWFKN